MNERQQPMSRTARRTVPVACLGGLSLLASAWAVVPSNAASTGPSAVPRVANVGVCRNQYSGPGCDTTTTSSSTTTRACDPNLLQAAEREFATASTFIDAGSKELGQAADSITDFRDSYIKEATKIGAEKLSLLNILDSLNETAAEIAEITGVYVGIGVLAEQLYFDVYPLFKDVSQLSQEAQDDFARGQQWAERAEADLQKALAQGPCPGSAGDQLKALRKQERLDDAAHALIDSWQNNGVVYINPLGGDVLDESAALKAAKAQLSAAAPAANTRLARSVVALAVATEPSKEELQTALVDLNKALSEQREATKKLALLVAATDKLRAGLGQLM